MFNTPIPDSPKLAANSTQVIARTLATQVSATVKYPIATDDHPNNLVASVNGYDGEPTYYSTSNSTTDPLFTLHCEGDPFGRPDGQCPLESNRIHIPAGAVPEGGPPAQNDALGLDRHLTVVEDYPNGIEYDMWQVKQVLAAGTSTRVPATSLPRSGGDLYMSWGGMTQLTGDGISDTALKSGTSCGTGCLGDARASRFGDLVGRLRPEELQAALAEETAHKDGVIHHALSIVIDCDNGSPVYPAQKDGHACHNETKWKDDRAADTDAPAMGALFQLNISADAIENGLTFLAPWQRVLLRTMKVYGMYLGDTGSRGFFGIETEAGSQYLTQGATSVYRSFGTSAGWALGSDNDLVGRLWSLDPAGNALWNQMVWSNLRVIDPCVPHKNC